MTFEQCPPSTDLSPRCQAKSGAYKNDAIYSAENEKMWFPFLSPYGWAGS